VIFQICEIYFDISTYPLVIYFCSMANFGGGGSQAFPNVVKNLIIINVIMVLLQFAFARAGINLDTYLALHYWASPLFRWWQPFTHMFMHGDPYDVQATVMHIFFNMYALWMFGRILENVWGPRRFVIFYIVCGLGAALCHMGVLTYEYTSYHNAFMHYQENPNFVDFVHFIKQYQVGINPQFISEWGANQNSPDAISGSVSALYSHYMDIVNEPTVGASGAVFGLLFAFGYLFPNTELYIIFIPIPIKAKWIVAGYALIELTQGLNNSAGDNIAHFAHLGGMLFAFILLRLWNNKIRNRFY
jgi:membrane associated rhomboid family serine protease